MQQYFSIPRRLDEFNKRMISCKLRSSFTRDWRSARHSESLTVAKNYAIGARISEPTYGDGSVVAVEDAFLRIAFDDDGVKKFKISLARLERSTKPAPASVRKRKRASKTIKPKTIKPKTIKPKTAKPKTAKAKTAKAKTAKSKTAKAKTAKAKTAKGKPTKTKAGKGRA